jgi:hypothetical protein
MPSPRRLSNGTLGTLIAAAGIVMMTIGVSSSAHPFAALPGMDGAMAAGTIGFVLALLHGLSFRRSVEIIAPVVLVQVLVSFRHDCTVLALIGLELGIFGLLGIASSWLREVFADVTA